MLGSENVQNQTKQCRLTSRGRRKPNNASKGFRHPAYEVLRCGDGPGAAGEAFRFGRLEEKVGTGDTCFPDGTTRSHTSSGGPFEARHWFGYRIHAAHLPVHTQHANRRGRYFGGAQTHRCGSRPGRFLFFFAKDVDEVDFHGFARFEWNRERNRHEDLSGWSRQIPERPRAHLGFARRKATDGPRRAVADFNVPGFEDGAAVTGTFRGSRHNGDGFYAGAVFAWFAFGPSAPRVALGTRITLCAGRTCGAGGAGSTWRAGLARELLGFGLGDLGDFLLLLAGQTPG